MRPDTTLEKAYELAREATVVTLVIVGAILLWTSFDANDTKVDALIWASSLLIAWFVTKTLVLTKELKRQSKFRSRMMEEGSIGARLRDHLEKLYDVAIRERLPRLARVVKVRQELVVEYQRDKYELFLKNHPHFAEAGYRANELEEHLKEQFKRAQDEFYQEFDLLLEYAEHCIIKPLDLRVENGCRDWKKWS